MTAQNVTDEFLKKTIMSITTAEKYKGGDKLFEVTFTDASFLQIRDSEFKKLHDQGKISNKNLIIIDDIMLA